MFNLVDEKERYLFVCKSMKGLSDLTLKAYKIDLQQFFDFMNEQNIRYSVAKARKGNAKFE